MPWTASLQKEVYLPASIRDAGVVPIMHDEGIFFIHCGSVPSERIILLPRGDNLNNDASYAFFRGLHPF
jgi:hypothetical protein